MRRAIPILGRKPLQQVVRGQRSVNVPLPAPTGGWDADSPLALMKEDRAVLLDNFFPTPDGIELRRGFWQHADTGQTTPVESLMSYNATTEAGDRLFAACNGVIYDVTSRSLPPIAAQTGLGSTRFQSINVANVGGQFLWCCNGVDAPRFYNGAAWATANITGITPANIVNVAAHKKRLWFALTNSLNAAYLPVDSVQGAASVFPLAGAFTKGGTLMAIGSWSTDAGEGGLDDLLVFISSRGQAAIYQGTDPAGSDLQIVGVWDFSPPLGRRCILRVANDLALITQEGVIPISAAVKTERGALTNVALTKRIRNAVTGASRLYGRNFGWQLVSHPVGNMAVLNVPLSEGTAACQYVMNTVTGAWSRFTGQNAICWTTYQDGLYFGGTGGKVYRADIAHADYRQPLVADLRGAFNSLRRPGVEKMLSMLRAIFTTDGQIRPALGVDMDYGKGAPLEGSFGAANAGDSLWDAFNWDEGDWSQEVATLADWIGVAGVGQMVSIRMRVVIPPGTETDYSSPPLFQLNGFNMIYETGGLL